MHIDLRGKVALVTGAARGIGYSIATTFAREGMTVIGLDVNAAGLEPLAQEAKAEGWAVETAVCNVRDAGRVQSLVGDIVERCGRLDILVNNAGVSLSGAVETQKSEDWETTLAVNLTGVFLMCQAVVPVMKRQRYGRILNAASFAALIPSVGGAAYAASKAGVVSFSRTLAGELGPWNITVNSYAPGMIPSEMNHFADAAPEQQERLLNTLTLRRWGDPADIAHLLCFLASDYAAYITGTVIDISGGKFATQMPYRAYELARKQEETQSGG